MAYSAEVSRSNPSCLLFLIDQSGSMADPWGGDDSRKKADELAVAVNRLLQNLIIKCAKAEGVRDYFYVGVIGYGAAINQVVAAHGSSEELIPLSLIAHAPIRIEERSRKIDDGAGGLVEQTVKFPVWLDAVANGGTPMCQALLRAHSVMQRWLVEHPNCFPPIVLNITDGEATDGDPAIPAGKLRELSSTDGDLLLFNVHLSSQSAAPVEFEAGPAGWPDEFAGQLFNMSSCLPKYMRTIAQQEGFNISEHARGFVFNGDIVSVIRFLDIGTRPANMR